MQKMLRRTVTVGTIALAIAGAFTLGSMAAQPVVIPGPVQTVQAEPLPAVTITPEPVACPTPETVYVEVPVYETDSERIARLDAELAEQNKAFQNGNE